MTAIDSAFGFIEIMRQINNERQRIIIKEGASYFTSTYKRIQLLFQALRERVGEYADLFFVKLSCEISDEHKYESVISLLSQEIHSFETWYLGNACLIDSLFSYEALSKAIEKDVEYEYGKERKESEDDFHEIYNDEIVWHSLARAYGSRSNCGRKSEQFFTTDDWDYISDSLEAFKKHFNVKYVNLPTMYEEYETKIKPRWIECSAKRDKIWEKCENYRRELHSELEYDTYGKIHGYLVPFKSYLDSGLRENENIEQTPKELANQKNNKFGRYKDLAECIPLEDIYHKVVSIAESYYESNGSIDGIFGYMLMTKLKGNGWLNDKGCTQAHFGELLIKEFGAKCSFKEGGAISDAKDKLDMKLKGMLDMAFNEV